MAHRLPSVSGRHTSSAIYHYLSNLSSYFHTLRYLRPHQALAKLLFKTKIKTYNTTPVFWNQRYEHRIPNPIKIASPPFLPGLKDLRPDQLADAREHIYRADPICKNQFTFLNHTHTISNTIDWHTREFSHLWRYQLHYFDYAWNLGVAYRLTNDRKYAHTFQYLIESWIAANPLGRLDGWHPYPVSLRAVNWIYARELLHPALDADFDHHLLRSLYKQCDYLYHNLEYQGYGNHLLANIKTLILGGLYFESPASRHWLKKSRQLLTQELNEQILPDGGHFERSPMYHLIMMKDLIECLAHLQRHHQPDLDKLRQKISQMADFAEALLQPDVRLPLFNDAAYDLSPDASELIILARHLCGNEDAVPNRIFSHLLLGKTTPTASSAASPSPSTALPETGYFVMRDKENTLLTLDCGPVCPDYLPPHAHADTLSFDLWLNAVPLIIDSGTYEYTAGPWRDFFRSTRAHNTVQIDHQNQSEIWGSFRVARRAYPKNVHWISTPEADYFSGAHTGYQRLPKPVCHTRKILYIKGAFWLIRDLITGVGEHTAESFLHLHPGVSIDQDVSGHVRLHHQDQILTVVPFGHQTHSQIHGQTDPIQGWYAPEFGFKTPRTTLSFARTDTPPFEMGYFLIPGNIGQAQCNVATENGRERHTITVDDRQWRIEVSPEGTKLSLL